MKKVIITICGIGILFLGFSVFAITTKTINYLNGNYGIGTTTPVHTLEVIGDVKTSMLRQTNTWHAYGYFENATTTIELTQNTWGKITNATGDLWTGVEANGMTLTNDTLTITNAGDYFGKLVISLYDVVNQDYEMRIYSTSTATVIPGTAVVTTSGNRNYIQMVLPIYFDDVTAGEQFELQIRNISSNNDPVITDSIFYISYLHD